MFKNRATGLFLSLILVVLVVELAGKESSVEKTSDPVTLITLHINSTPAGAKVFINDEEMGVTPLKIQCDADMMHELVLKKENYAAKYRLVQLNKDTRIKLLLDQAGSWHDHIANIKTGCQPKQVAFSPDNKLLFTTLLGDINGGVEVIDGEQLTNKGRISFGAEDKKSGFVEVVFNSTGTVAWVSQMTTHQIYGIETAGQKVFKTIDTKGNWSKVIALRPDGGIAYVANWLSHDISVIDLSIGQTIKLVKTGKIPRGIAFTPDGQFAYIVHYGDNQIVKIAAQKHTVVKRFKGPGTHLRHIVIDQAAQRAYISDLTAKGKIHVLDLTNDTIIKTIPVDSHPNTIELSSDQKYLYVSCRGIWSEHSTRKQWIKGSVYIINTGTLTTEEIIPGGYEPTGLDLSNDGEMLCFSDFRDNILEFYHILDRASPREKQLFFLHPAEIENQVIVKNRKKQNN